MPTTDLMSALVIDSATFMLQYRQEISRQAGGNPRGVDLGTEIWLAKIGASASVMSNGAALQASALVNKLRGMIGSFYVWDPRAQYPQADPTGSILGASTVTIYAFDATSIRLAGLPVGYQITRGDKFSFAHGSSPVHQCLHEFSDSVVADGAGRTASTLVAPGIKAGASTGLAVSLIRPVAEMFIMPGSFDFPSGGPLHSSISFTAVQVP